MNEILNQYLTPELTAIIMTAVIVPVLRQVVRLFNTFVDTKVNALQEGIHNDKLNRYIDMAEDAVFTAVDSVSQTYVNSLKTSNSFDAEAQGVAFDKAKIQALGMLSTEAKEMLHTLYGDLDVWVDGKIETYVKNGKIS